MNENEFIAGDAFHSDRKKDLKHSEKGEAELNYLLMMQTFICVAIVILVLAIQRSDKPAFQSIKRQFTDIMDKSLVLDDKLLRFTSANLKENIAAFPGDGDENMRYGSGGYKPAKYPAVPEGYSLKNFVPNFQLNIPVKYRAITSEYGWRRHPISKKSDFHTGVDLAAAEGTFIKPAAEGVVIKATRSRSYGNYVLVLHKDGVTTKYCHMQYIFVHTGDIVSADSALGTVGKTGIATGPHLHFELMYNDIGCNPKKALRLE